MEDVRGRVSRRASEQVSRASPLTAELLWILEGTAIERWRNSANAPLMLCSSEATGHSHCAVAHVHSRDLSGRIVGIYRYSRRSPPHPCLSQLSFYTRLFLTLFPVPLEETPSKASHFKQQWRSLGFSPFFDLCLSLRSFSSVYECPHFLLWLNKEKKKEKRFPTLLFSCGFQSMLLLPLKGKHFGGDIFAT